MMSTWKGPLKLSVNVSFWLELGETTDAVGTPEAGTAAVFTPAILAGVWMLRRLDQTGHHTCSAFGSNFYTN